MRREWLRSAVFPERIEYLVAVTRGDRAAMSQTRGSKRVIVEDSPDGSTAVRNWNLLAAEAEGEILFVIADDLFPREQGWDLALDKIAGRFSPIRHSYVVKVTDSPSGGDTKVRHPVVSRRFYTRFGLWNSGYSGMYVDTDFTLSAFWQAAIIDGRNIVLEHANPIANPTVSPSVSFAKANSAQEYDRGKALFDRRWPRFLQGTRIALVGGEVRLLDLASARIRLREALMIIVRSRFFNWMR